MPRVASAASGSDGRTLARPNFGAEVDLWDTKSPKFAPATNFATNARVWRAELRKLARRRGVRRGPAPANFRTKVELCDEELREFAWAWALPGPYDAEIAGHWAEIIRPAKVPSR